MSSTQMVVVPHDIQLPAHLQGPAAAAAIAAANAAAGGGIKTGGFPRISKSGSKFHILEDGNLQPLMNPPTTPGQPALPMMLLQVAIVGSVPSLSKVFFKGKFNAAEVRAPDCSSSDAQVPDVSIAAPQSKTCATCPQNVWGSKISEFSNKPIKACDDTKVIALFPVLPDGTVDTSKVYGNIFTVSELGEWGDYVKAITAKGLPIQGIITNLTMDPSVQHPKIICSFGGFLREEEYAKVQARATDADVLNIIAPVKAPAVLALSAPTLPPVPAHVPVMPVVPSNVPMVPTVPVVPQVPVVPVAPPPVVPLPPVAPPPAVTGFGGGSAVAVAPPPAQAPVVVAPVVPPPAAEQPKPKRAPRKQAEAVTADARIAHMDAGLQATIMSTGGPDGAVGQALLAQFPAPAQTPPPVVTVTPPVAAVPVPPVANGFGGVTVPAVPVPPAAGVVTAAQPNDAATAALLKEKLAAFMNNPAAAATGG